MATTYNLGKVTNGFIIIGYYSDLTALQTAITDPSAGDAYGVGSAEPYSIYVWDSVGSSWVDNGMLKGDKGDTGETGPQGPQGLTGEAGIDGESFNWMGIYSAGITYAPGEAVSYNGSSYMCKLESTGNLPTNTTYWDLLAQKGADGTGAGDMVKSTYDSNDDGAVNDSDALGGLVAANWQKQEVFTTTGSANAYEVTTGRNYISYFEGMTLCIKIHVSSTSTAINLNVDGIGEVAVKCFGANNAWSSLFYRAGGVYEVKYDGTYFQVVNYPYHAYLSRYSQIEWATEETSLDDSDAVPIFDNSSANYKKTLFSSIVNYIKSKLDGYYLKHEVFTTGGSANAYTVTTGRSLTAYYEGLTLRVKVHANSTSAFSTFNVDGLGAQNLYVYGTQVAFSSVFLKAGSIWDIVYDGSNFILKAYAYSSYLAGTASQVQFYGWTEETSLADADMVAGYDESASVLRKFSLLNLWNYIKDKGDTIYQPIVYQGSSSTAVATAEKAVTASGYTEASGQILLVLFANVNTASSPTLNVNSGTARSIYLNGAAVQANLVPKLALLRYNGTQYDLLNPIYAGLNSNGYLNNSQGLFPPVNVTSSKTAGLADAGTAQFVNSASNLTMTLPNDTTAAIPAGSVIRFWRQNTGTVQFSVEGGASFACDTMDRFIADQYGWVDAVKVAANTWSLIGSLAAS